MPLKPANMEHAASLVFDAMSAVVNDRAVRRALEEDEVTSTSLMEVVADQLCASVPGLPVDLVLAKSGKGDLEEFYDPRTNGACHFFTAYLRVDEWFMCPDVDSVFSSPGQSSSKLVAFRGEDAVFEYERLRMPDAAPGELNHGIVPMKTTPRCPVSFALVASAIAPVLASRVRDAMQARTDHPTLPTSGLPRL